MTIRKVQIDDLEELQKLFVDTITTICKADYDEKQIEAWTSGVNNKQRWQNILTNQLVMVSQKDGKITGFCTLNCNHIDLFYVHKDHQREGIAKKLYAEIVKVAEQQGQTELTSDVSKTARPFFEKVGFVVMVEQKVMIGDIELTNFKMTKKIA
ncbi:MAG: GNAT family N-acetyltransferase [Bacteroidota bacterium]|nr:GNAT family N-acetyltransferase [Bacteroidota bacterium]